MTPKRRSPQRQPQPSQPVESDDWPVDAGRPWLLRLLALVGALAFVMLGISSLLPVLQEPPSKPMPGKRDGSVS